MALLEVVSEAEPSRVASSASWALKDDAATLADRLPRPALDIDGARGQSVLCLGRAATFFFARRQPECSLAILSTTAALLTCSTTPYFGSPPSAPPPPPFLEWRAQCTLQFRRTRTTFASTLFSLALPTPPHLIYLVPLLRPSEAHAQARKRPHSIFAPALPKHKPHNFGALSAPSPLLPSLTDTPRLCPHSSIAASPLARCTASHSALQCPTLPILASPRFSLRPTHPSSGPPLFPHRLTPILRTLTAS